MLSSKSRGHEFGWDIYFQVSILVYNCNPNKDKNRLERMRRLHVQGFGRGVSLFESSLNVTTLRTNSKCNSWRNEELFRPPFYEVVWITGLIWTILKGKKYFWSSSYLSFIFAMEWKYHNIATFQNITSVIGYSKIPAFRFVFANFSWRREKCQNQLTQLWLEL